MKKIFFLLFTVIALTGCDTEPLDPGLIPLPGVVDPGVGTGGGGSGGGTTIDTSLLVGDWLYVDVESFTTTTTTVMGNPVVQNASASFVSSDAILSFTANGTYTLTGDLTFELFNNGVSAGNQTNSFNDAGTYTVTGDVLEMVSTAPGATTPFDDSTVFTIDTVNATDLLLDFDGTSTQTIGGATVEIVIEGAADFEKQ